MARDLKLNLDIATKAAQQGLKATSKAAKDLSTDVESMKSKGQQVAAAMSAMADQMVSDFKEADAAAEALGQALGGDLRTKIESTGGSIDQMVGKLRETGLTYDEIRADADALAESIKRLDQAGSNMDGVSTGANKLKGDLDGVGTNAKQATGHIDKLGHSSDQTRSVMANMVGNTTQDLAGLGGVAGTAGMALGQLGEYAAEGNIALSGLAGTAGPMVLLGATVAVLTDHLAEVKKLDAFNTAQVVAFVDALKDGVITTDEFYEALKGGEKTPSFVSMVSGEVEDLDPILLRLGMTYKDFEKIVASGIEATNEWGLAQDAAGANTDDTWSIIQAAADIRMKLAKADKEAADAAKLRGETVSKVSAAQVELNAATAAGIRGSDDLASATETAGEAAFRHARETDAATVALEDNTAAAEAAAAEARRVERATDRAADAAKDHVDSLQDEKDAIDDVTDAAHDQSDALRAAADSTIAVSGATNDYVLYLQGLPKAIDDAKGNQAELNALWAEGRDNAVELADAVVENAVQQFASTGVIVTTAQKLDIWNQSMLNTAATADGPLRDAILGFIAEANDIPPEKVTEIRALLDQDKFAEAQTLLDDVSVARDVALQLEVDERSAANVQRRIDAIARAKTIPIIFEPRTSSARSATGLAGGTDRWSGGPVWVGERGKELVNLPEGSQVIPNNRLQSIPGLASGTQNVTHTTAAGSGASTDERMAAMFELEELSLDDYKAYLQGRQATMVKYTAGYMEMHRKIERLDEQKANTAKQAMEDEDELQKFLYDSGQITLAQYKAYLQERRSALDQYSEDARELWSEIHSLEESVASARTSSASTAKTADDAAAAKALADQGMALGAAFTNGVPPVVINVTGALDPPRVAQQIVKLIGDHNKRNGTVKVAV